MENCINEYELSFSAHIWNNMLYCNLDIVQIDVYFNENGFPKKIHDSFGSNAVEEFRITLINEIKNRNSANSIWRISSDAFAIPIDDKNCSDFEFEFKGIKHKILKKSFKLYKI